MRKGKIPLLITVEGIRAEKFWTKVAPPNENVCRLWIAKTMCDGYGMFNVTLPDGRYVPARSHRVAYALHHGEAPYGQLVLHSCDVRLCCSKEHLRLGSDADNARDIALRGRHGLRARINLDVARVIREMHRDGASAAYIADILELRPALVGYVVRGQTWREQ